METAQTAGAGARGRIETAGGRNTARRPRATRGWAALAKGAAIAAAMMVTLGTAAPAADIQAASLQLSLRTAEPGPSGDVSSAIPRGQAAEAATWLAMTIWLFRLAYQRTREEVRRCRTQREKRGTGRQADAAFETSGPRNG